MNKDLLGEYASALKAHKKDKAQLSSLTQELQEVLKAQDYDSFLLEELYAAQLKEGEQVELETIYEQLNNVEFIKEHLDKSLAISNDDQYGIALHLNEMKSALQRISNFSVDYESLSERVNSLSIELKDVVDELSRLNENLAQDPKQLEMVNQKLQSIYNLQKKHHVGSVEELLLIQETLSAKAVSVSNLENEIAKLEVEIASAEKQLDSVSQKIHQNRIKSIPMLIEKWTEILNDLGMPNVRFKMELTPVSQYLPNGKDGLQFLFSANKGSDFGLLKKVASGGEMSRIMLATKAILAQYSHLPTIIFDEIDTGVSGEIANKMGEIMKGMSSQMQVFAITHLPQIAAKGSTHFKVFKSVVNDGTQTELKVLSNEERVVEIAQMLSGTTVSDSALNHAKALLN